MWQWFARAVVRKLLKLAAGLQRFVDLSRSVRVYVSMCVHYLRESSLQDEFPIKTPLRVNLVGMEMFGSDDCFKEGVRALLYFRIAFVELSAERM